ncbi:hypothetical protein T440DRAFT_559605 [Plenodomus tracheiphilus IPT5]|uniref:Uncharacterized protein n=1 Tax=Plenodomus tracheiphilus IPT5 TaxID=1408161 RepID=A0A6A7AQM7_9PLEO|nr:hypothetical protein T440DRAFT_559605 [Plenodomus tracheiphilus IPT5]
MTSPLVTPQIKEEPNQAGVLDASSVPLVEIHQHLVHLSQLVQNLYGDLRHHQSRYEQAYLSEQQKLQHSVAAYRTLELENERLAQENRYCRDQLLPGYDNVLCRQAQENKDYEAKILDLESKARGKDEEHRQTLDALEGQLRERDQKLEELEASIQARSEIQDHPPPPPVARKRHKPSEITVKKHAPADRGTSKKFDLASSLFEQPSSSSSQLTRRDLLQDLQNVQNGANSIVTTAATGVSNATQQLQSAVSSAASSLADLDDIFPQNCSVGTKQLCFGYKHSSKNRTACRDLPFDLSGLMPDGAKDLPEAVTVKLGELVNSVAPLVRSLTSFPTSHLANTLIVGLLLTISITGSAVLLTLSQPANIARKFRNFSIRQRFLLHSLLGAACCCPFLLLAPLLFVLTDSPKKSPSWVVVKTGEVPALGFGALGCAVCLAVCLASLPAADWLQQKDAAGRGGDESSTHF